jgi:diguanylate cyclase
MSDLNLELSDTTEIARRALLKMAQLEVPVTPQNYHIWFEYYTGANEELVGQIDETMDRGRPFDRELNQILYSRYVEKEKDKALMQEIQAETQKILKNIFDEILATSDFASGYRARLEDYSQELKSAEELQHIQRVIKKLIKDTHQMAESTNSLHQKLEEATTNTEALRQRLERTEREALKDALTGLYNRKAFDRKVKELNESFKKGGDAFSVIILDVDFFKGFNDRYGHKIGDEVLRKVGSILHESVKGGDFPARYGGEEFVVLLPKTDLPDACTVAEQIRKRISEKRLKRVSTGESLGNITVSLGVSKVGFEDTTDSVVERADKALYLAKNSGRNNTKSERDLS